MQTEDLKIKLASLQPALIVEEGGQWLNVVIEPGQWKPFAEQIRTDPDLQFDYLFCLTCIDWKSHLTMVYHLESTRYRHIIVVKSKLPTVNAEIETVSDLWRT